MRRRIGMGMGMRMRMRMRTRIMMRTTEPVGAGRGVGWSLKQCGACVCIPEAVLGSFANNVAHKLRIAPLGPGAVIRGCDFCQACCTSLDPVLGTLPSCLNVFYHLSSVLSVHWYR